MPSVNAQWQCNLQPLTHFISTENAVQFNKPKDVPICSTRFLDVLISFFTFYSEFKFGENIVSVFEGREVSHNIRNADDDRLDPSLLRYFNSILFPSPLFIALLNHLRVICTGSSVSSKQSRASGRRMECASKMCSCISET